MCCSFQLLVEGIRVSSKLALCHGFLFVYIVSHSIMILLVDVNREKASAENAETKVSQVCLVNPVQPG